MTVIVRWAIQDPKYGYRPARPLEDSCPDCRHHRNPNAYDVQRVCVRNWPIDVARVGGAGICDHFEKKA